MGPPNAIAQLENTERVQIMRQGQMVANPAQTKGCKYNEILKDG